MSRLKVNQIIPFNDFGIGVGAVNGKASAIFNIQSSTQGVLFPSMTTAERNTIAAPWDGLFIYNLDNHAYEHYNSLTSAWESVDGIQSLNGLTAKIQTFATGSAGFSPNWVSSGTAHTLNIPFARDTAVNAGLVSKGEWDSFNIRLFPVQNTKYVVKNSVLGPQDYNSINDALDSITDASSLNPYIIYVGPGIFTEQQIEMKPFVTIIGTDDSTSIIKAASSSVPLIVGSHSSEIKQIQLSGPTDTGVPLIYYTGMQANSNSFSVVECAFDNASLIYKIDNNNDYITSFRTEGCRIVSTTSVEGIIAIDGSNSQPMFCFFSGFIYRRMVSPYPDHLMDIKGQNARVILDGVLIETNSSSSHGIHIEDGVNLGILNTVLSGLNVAFHVHNIGAAPTINSANFALRNCTQDILIEHPGTSGSLNGAANINKTTVDDNATITLSMIDVENGGTFDTGPLSLGRKTSFLTNVSDLLEAAPAMGIITGGFIVDQGGFDIEIGEGFGYVQVNPFPDHRIRRLQWPNTTISLSADQDVYVYVNSSGILTFSGSIGNTTDIILIGRVVTNSTGIELIDQSPMLARHAVNYINRMFRDALGSIYDSGSIVTENATPFKLDITAGTYFFSFNRYTPAGGNAINFTQYYKDGLGGFNSSVTDTVNSTHYDDGSGTLVPLSPGNYVKHTIYVNCDDADEKYFVVIGQAQYAALAAVESAPLPTPPSWVKDAVTPIASIVIEEGNSNIVEFIDIRPVIGFKSSGVSASADHGNLLGLADDDHPQYLLVSGSRAMAGNLNMGNNNINNVGTINGITIEAHASRHLPNGADPIATAAPSSSLSAITSNSTGVANSLARSDHSHAILTGTASTQVPDQSNAAGTSANLARADHVHNIPTAAPNGTIGANSVNGQGVAASFSRGDHQHQVATGTPSTQIPDQANAAGSSNNLARADHTHAIPTGVPVSVADANAQGAAASFARADHVHAHGLQTNPAQHAVATPSANGFMSSADKSKLDGISGTRIFKSGIVAGGSFAGNPKTFAVVFGTPFPDTNYTISIVGANGRTWNYQSKTAAGFTINANANAALSGEVSWTAIGTGETVE